MLLEYVAQDTLTQAFEVLTPEQQTVVRTDAEERYLSYVFLRQSGKQHSNLKRDLQNGFTTGDNRYPRTRQQTLHLLDKYSKTITATAVQSEGTSFAQNGGKDKKKGKGNSDDYDKKYWKDKQCYNCQEKGHPSTHCPHKDDDKEDDTKSVRSTAKSVTKLNKKVKQLTRAFAQLKEDQAENSDLSGSDEEEADSHFQFQFTQVKSEFEPPIANLFKQAHGIKMELPLRDVILLDSQSTMDLFCNRALVTKIIVPEKSLRLKSNGGTMIVTKKAQVAGYHTDVWYNRSAITNILALKNVIKQYRVTYDSDDHTFVVHRKQAGLPNMNFRMHPSGLHFYDPQEEGLALLTTVSGNKEGFTKRQIKDAERARSLYAALSYPSHKDFRWVIRSNQIKDCPVTVQDVDNAFKIWGKNIAALKGKTVRGKPMPVARDFVKVPTELMKLHKEVFLTCDIFFVNKIPFFLTLSRKICFTAVNHLANRTVPEIFKAFREIYQYYLQRGFRITTVHADGEFAPLKGLIDQMPGGPTTNLASSNEHVPEIERRIRVVKERCRSTRHGLPFTRVPRLLTIHIVLNCVKLLNFFPTKGGVSETLSPKTIMSGETLDFKKHLSLQVGQYCQVHEEEQPRNSEIPRTRGAISLGPSGNLQGAYKFIALNTGKKITRRSWDVIPMPDTVIARVNELANDQPEQFTFTDKHGRIIGDTDNIDNFPGVDFDDDNDHIPGVPPASYIEQLPAVDDVEPTGVDIQVEPEQNLDPVQETFEPIVEIHDDLDTPPPIVQETAPTAETTQEPAGVRRSTRARQPPKNYVPTMSGTKYDYAVSQLADQGVINPDAHMFFQQDFYQYEPDVVATVMTQLSLKTGLKEWGKRAYDAAASEMKQLHLRNTFKPKHLKQLTDVQRKTLLESHMFLKEKRDGKIKGRTVAGGNKQRDYISKEDASSPTVATESVLLSCIIDAEEGRDVAVVDIPNAFVQTAVEDEKDMAIIRLRGDLVDILVSIAPDVYKKFVTTDRKGSKVLIVQCQNALYGTMQASLLYYRKFTQSLTKIGFELNPYDPCVANKTIEGEQMTICFHVDDCKVSHRSSKVVDDIIGWLRENYESIFEDGSGAMTVSRGVVHKYLGMKLDYSTRGQVKITMIPYIDEILNAFDKADPNAKGIKSSAALDNLFKIDDDCEKLSQAKAVQFHNIVAKTLYATKRARPDTCTAIAFLTTRVRAPDKDDWMKLSHLMKYLRGTRNLPLILSADGSGIMKWWVDASFAVHPNMRGHSGGGLSMGQGFPIVSSTKQKLNTRSSTETEVVGADDFMPMICWTRQFLEAQGYQVNDNILLQDNKSAILLESNGKASSSKRTKHIKIRYFFITDRVSKGDLSIAWCPTDEMVGDFMTKPLQGAKFRKFRDLIMGVNVKFGAAEKRPRHRSVLGNNGKTTEKGQTNDDAPG